MRRLIALFSLLFACWSPSLHAEPTHVHVGAFVNQLYDMKLRDNQVTVDFYIWFRWKGDDVNPANSFEVVNGKIESKEFQPERTVDGWRYAQGRVLAVLNKQWDVKRFPVDTQTITIEIEDADSVESSLIFIPDQANSRVGPKVSLPGYKVVATSAATLSNEFYSNFGDISQPTDARSVYSRFVQTIEISRPGYGYYTKVFLPTIIAAWVAFLAFLVKPIDLDPRFGLGVGALFAVVATALIIQAELPQGADITLADQINILSMMMIFLSIIQSAISLKLYEKEPDGVRRSVWFDRVSFVLFPAVYLGGVAVATLAG